MHPIGKYPKHIIDPATAENMMLNNSPMHIYINCPCGTRLRRWNYAHHCSFPKHKAWVAIMPQPTKIKSWSSLEKKN
jgi:hypothetical protein